MYDSTITQVREELDGIESDARVAVAALENEETREVMLPRIVQALIRVADRIEAAREKLGSRAVERQSGVQPTARAAS